MSTIIMAILILAFTIILPWIFIKRHKNAVKKQKSENFRRFSTAGTERNLSFTRQEVIQKMIVGLDGIQQVLMIAELDNNYDIAVIALKDLAKCSLDKVYYTAGDTAAEKEKVLKEIRLVFDFHDNRLPIYIVFYDHHEDSIYLMGDMEAKAREWQRAISMLLSKSAVAKL